MSFIDTLNQLCKEKGVSITTVTSDPSVNLSHGCVTRWKNGSIPNGDALVKLADYFDVSVDYLLGREPITDPSDMANSQALGSFKEGVHRFIREPDHLTLSDIERDVILSLRRQPEMITPICRLLGIPEPADKAAES